MSEEKRRYVRWRKKIKVAYSLKDTEEHFEEIFTEDLSEVGLQILVSDKLQLKQTIRLKLEFVYDPVPIIAGGKVVFVKACEDKYRVGLEFIDMDDFQRYRLKLNLDKVRQDFRDEIKEERYA